MTEQAREFAFQAEVQRLLDLVIHSLYTDKEIFLRELISNASDAIDRLRFEALTRPDLVPAAYDPKIRLVPHRENRTLTIDDDGIGMTRDEVVQNIGTIARSGTREALETLKESAGEGAGQLIGQFGVGFYSSFMVADRVDLVTRKAGTDEAVRWSSSGGGTFTVTDAERERPGTTITLHLKPVDAENGIEDYTDPWVLRRIVRQHADFITYPVLLPPGEPAEGETAEEEKPLNSMKPIWARPPSEVTQEEYADFYKQLSHDWSEPLETIHTRGEGLVEYQAVLFIPSRAGVDVYYPGFKPNLRLYVKRMLVRENSEELLPSWMRWVRGAVDSPDLPLNVSREMLQSDRHVRQIRRTLTRKVLDTLKRLLESDRAKYEAFWTELGRAVKEGVDDYENRDAVAHLLLFGSSGDPEALTTLQEYVERMPEGQTDVWYLTGTSREQIENSPALEAFRDRGWEVLYLTDPVDELVAQSLSDFEGRRLRSAARGEVEVGEAEKKEAADEAKKEFEPFLDAMRKRLDEWVKEVRLSGRLTKSPAVLVVAEHDLSPQMERILSAARGGAGFRQKRILELNAGHPLVQGLRRRFAANADDPLIADYADLLLDWALLAEGSEPHAPVRFTQLVAGLMEKGLDSVASGDGQATVDSPAES